jgi:hypothetical protein
MPSGNTMQQQNLLMSQRQDKDFQLGLTHLMRKTNAGLLPPLPSSRVSFSATEGHECPVRMGRRRQPAASTSCPFGYQDIVYAVDSESSRIGEHWKRSTPHLPLLETSIERNSRRSHATHKANPLLGEEAGTPRGRVGKRLYPTEEASQLRDVVYCR